MKRIILLLPIFFLSAAAISFVGSGKQGPDGPIDCSACHRGAILSGSGLVRSESGGYRTAPTRFGIELGLSHGNTNGGWRPDSTTNVLGFAIAFRDTSGRDAGTVSGCGCVTGGDFRHNGGFAESVSLIPAGVFRSARDGRLARGTTCEITFRPFDYTGAVIVTTRVVFADTAGIFPDIGGTSRDTFEVDIVSAIERAKVRERMRGRFFLLDGREVDSAPKSGAWAEGGKVRVRIF